MVLIFSVVRGLRLSSNVKCTLGQTKGGWKVRQPRTFSMLTNNGSPVALNLLFDIVVYSVGLSKAELGMEIDRAPI